MARVFPQRRGAGHFCSAPKPRKGSSSLGPRLANPCDCRHGCASGFPVLVTVVTFGSPGMPIPMSVVTFGPPGLRCEKGETLACCSSWFSEFYSQPRRVQFLLLLEMKETLAFFVALTEQTLLHWFSNTQNLFWCQSRAGIHSNLYLYSLFLNVVDS